MNDSQLLVNESTVDDMMYIKAHLSVQHMLVKALQVFKNETYLSLNPYSDFQIQKSD